MPETTAYINNRVWDAVKDVLKVSGLDQELSIVEVAPLSGPAWPPAYRKVVMDGEFSDEKDQLWNLLVSVTHADLPVNIGRLRRAYGGTPTGAAIGALLNRLMHEEV